MVGRRWNHGPCSLLYAVDEEIVFDDASLIIGANDSGKTNLLYALRILLDPSLSVRDFELQDADFNVQSRADQVVITAYFENGVFGSSRGLEVG